MLMFNNSYGVNSCVWEQMDTGRHVYVITHSVRSMCMYVCVCMWYFAKLITVSTYIDVLSMGLGHNDPWVESHM